MSLSELADDRLVGEWRQPRNRWSASPTSIHNDDQARKIGMRGGTIPGTVHFDHFRPLIEEVFGDAWRECGSISMYYTYATLDGEDVRAIMKRPPEGWTPGTPCHVDAWVETPEGRVVCKGTIGIGAPEKKSYVMELPLEDSAPGVVRILAKMEIGDETPEREVVVEAGEDGIVTGISALYGVLNAGFPRAKIALPSVGFFGATDVQMLKGPIRTGVPYKLTGKVVSIGETGKTEYCWVDNWLRDADGELVATMRHMTRWMKVSSPLWTG
jgi:hypothetical protein